jgi:hypothetical protein
MRIEGTIVGLVLSLTLAATAQTSITEHAQRQATALYPDLAVPGSGFHTAFLRAVAELRQRDPNFTSDSSWPLKVAKSLAPEPVTLRYTIVQALEKGAVVEAGSERVYIEGLTGLDGDRGQVRVWPAGEFGGQTVGAGFRKMKGYTTSCSSALINR